MQRRSLARTFLTPAATSSPLHLPKSAKTVVEVFPWSHLRVSLADCAGFFLQALILRRILNKDVRSCMNMLFAKQS